jgi:hypothetical protein
MQDIPYCDCEICRSSDHPILYGHCHCKCGGKTAIAKKTYTAQHQTKGKPNRFIAGHSLPKHPDYVVDGNGCWIWQGAHDYDGYGLINRLPLHRGNAHIYFYKLHVGLVPEGLEIDHLCRVRDCVNPAHLKPKPHKENVLIGESPTAKNARKTHCKRGHELAGDNIYIGSNGGRRCRICQKAYMRAYHLQRKAKRAGGDP